MSPNWALRGSRQLLFAHASVELAKDILALVSRNVREELVPECLFDTRNGKDFTEEKNLEFVPGGKDL